MSMSDLYNKVNYSNGIDYFSGYIIEYDLSKANINALLSRGIIDKDYYTFLYNAEKKYREVTIGNMIKKDEKIYKEIQLGIKDAKRMFIEKNNIQDEEILSIRNDALFILSERPMEQQFGYYYFAKKNVFTLFFKFFKNKEFYYRFDQNSMKDIIEVKGISDENLIPHREYFLKFLADISYSIQRSTIEETLNIYNAFLSSYLNRTLDIHFYREFNSYNAYRISMSDGRSFFISALENSPQIINQLDINYNLKILRDLGIIIDKMYFNQKR